MLLLAASLAKASLWTYDLVDHSGTAQFTSLKIDKSGNAHLAYVTEDANDTLKYAFWDHLAKRWFVMTVAEHASFAAMVLDSKQHPHISFADVGTVPGCRLRYAYWDGAAWKVQAIPLNADTIAYYTSIALDKSDNPTISFYEYDGPRGSSFRVRMRVVSWNGQYWQVRTVDGRNQSGKFNALAIDSENHVHLAYANVNALTAGMRYGYWDGNSWHVEMIEGLEQNTGYVGYSTNIVVDKDGNPHLTYSNYSNPAVKYAVRKNGVWTTQVIDRITAVGYPDRNSITMDDQGRVYIGYYDAGVGTLKIAHQDGRTWVTEVVDTDGSGFTSSLQIADGVLWISYQDSGDAGIKVARRELSAQTVGGGLSALSPVK